MKTFLICPVRSVSDNELKIISRFVANLEMQGTTVYWPYRDTDQNDNTGNKICSSNLLAMRDADVVYVWWNPESTGSVFDLGMAWALGKKIKLANDVPITKGKSFGNLLRWLDK